MRQVVQPVTGGPVRVEDVPRPSIGPTEVLVRTTASVISPGTERAVTRLAQSSLVAKARARPDLVRQVVRKARTEGVAAVARSVRARLGEELPLGYSAAGIALDVGDAVGGIRPGQLVATAGAGRANHAEFQAVPGLLCVPVPGGVSAGDAAFATLGAVALHGLRLAHVGPGTKIVVVGLGLIGQLAARLAVAAGCEVFGIDVTPFAVQRAVDAGVTATLEAGDATTSEVLAWSRGRGADAVVVAAATPDSKVIARVPALCRDRATVVVIGDVGLGLDRAPFYERELTLRFARSYGPGRYDRSYEDWGVDYPVGYVRWTEARNMEAVLDLLAAGRLVVGDLVTHRFPIAEASAAYQLVEQRSEPHLAIQLTYPGDPDPRASVVVATRRRRVPRESTGGPGLGLIGAGAFASTVLVPALRSAGVERLVSVASASGLSARRLAERAGFEKAVPGGDAVIDDPDVDLVVIASAHDTHASFAAAALRASKHVFCEKPLALTDEELDDVETAWRESGRVLFVGFNRRWSKSVAVARRHLDGRSRPIVVSYRVSADCLPEGHWYHDRRQGGRLLGEVCHFVDTCAALVGADATSVAATAASQPGTELVAADDWVISLAYPDGSLASVTYASSGHPSTEKERVEILGGGTTVLIDDFRRVVLDGKVTELRAHDKGHSAAAVALLRAVQAVDAGGAEPALLAPGRPFASMRATIGAARSLGLPPVRTTSAQP